MCISHYSYTSWSMLQLNHPPQKKDNTPNLTYNNRITLRQRNSGRSSNPSPSAWDPTRRYRVVSFRIRLRSPPSFATKMNGWLPLRISGGPALEALKRQRSTVVVGLLVSHLKVAETTQRFFQIGKAKVQRALFHVVVFFEGRGLYIDLLDILRWYF